MVTLSSLTDEAKIALSTLSDRTNSVFNPAMRLGVTGLSRAGKTVFITSLIQNLMTRGRLPTLSVAKEGRLIDVVLEHQPDDAVARFEYEKHLDAILNQRIWPQSTHALAEIRLTIRFSPKISLKHPFSRGKISIDLIDYPGEWLLDLPLLNKTYREFSAQSIERAKQSKHADLWLAQIQSINVFSKANELEAENLSNSFKNYLKSAKADEDRFSMLQPGRFLMPGEFAGTPLLTFCPLPNLSKSTFPKDSLAAMMERRYESYKKLVVKPFFREHVARLDRQIILVDALQCLNAGMQSVVELQNSLADILSCFRAGKRSWVASLWQHRIGKILVAATKADHLHHSSHEHLQHLTGQILSQALVQAGINGADTDCLAMASIRTTREGKIQQSKDELPVIIGTPLKGEKFGGQTFDGETETAVFPGDLPKDLSEVPTKNVENTFHFIRFRPPVSDGAQALAHIRLDRAIEFLIGDYLS